MRGREEQRETNEEDTYYARISPAKSDYSIGMHNIH